MLIKHICFGNITVSDVAVSTRSFEDRVRYSLELGIPYGFLSLGESYEKMELPSYEEEPIQINGRTIGTIYETEVLTEDSSIGVFRHPFHTGLYLRELEEEKDSDLITKQLLSINLDRERYQIIGVTVTPYLLHPGKPGLHVCESDHTHLRSPLQTHHWWKGR